MIKDYIKLARVPNLAFIAGIQLLMHYCVVVPVLGKYDMEPSMNALQLALLVIATVFIAAGGYVINDYFDMRIDEINRPETRIVGQSVSRKQAMLFYQVISGIGVVAGLFLSLYYAKSITYGFVFLMILGLLWFYSSSYKRQLVVGNLIIAFLAAMVPFIVALFENRFLFLFSDISIPLETLLPVNSLIMRWLGGFALFAFLWTFIREVIKDIEDMEGDREMESHTFPVVLGVFRTKILLYTLIGTALITGGYVVFVIAPIEGSFSWRYFLSLVVIPAVYLIYMLFKAQNKADYRQAAFVAKLIMILGTLYSVVVWYSISFKI